MNSISPQLLARLRCPLTQSALREEEGFLVAEVGGLRYPIRDGIPDLLLEDAVLPAGVASLDALKERMKGEG